ncbi:MAG TPA: hypothetical protein VK459_04825, partial [Polyangiaceae bacterium]|nr:hypothetical protein [Polyangiaceae bacterium]
MRGVTVGAARPGQRASTRRAAAAIAVALGLAAAPASARADDACIGAYERTQIARKAGRLVDARAEAMACSQPACPAGMVTECAQWRGEIEREIEDRRNAASQKIVAMHTEAQTYSDDVRQRADEQATLRAQELAAVEQEIEARRRTRVAMQAELDSAQQRLAESRQERDSIDAEVSG